jgi:predicted RecB family endonuclease
LPADFIDINSVRTLIDRLDRLVSQGAEYAVGLYPFICSPEGFKHRNVVATLGPAFGGDVARRVYSDLVIAFKDVNRYARVKVGDREGSLWDYLRIHYLLKEHVFKPVLEEGERRLSRIPEEDRRVLSVACAIIVTLLKNKYYHYPSKGHPVLWISWFSFGHSSMLDSPSLSSIDEEYFSMVVSSVLGSKVTDVRSLFYKYLLGFQDDKMDPKHYYYELVLYPFVAERVRKLAEEAPRYVRVLEDSDVMSRISDLYRRGDFLKLAVVQRSLHTREQSELLSHFSGMPYEDLCEWASVEGMVGSCFVNPLVMDSVRTAIEALYEEALSSLMKLFVEVFSEAWYDSSCVSRCCVFTKPLAKPVFMCFSPWPEDVPRDIGDREGPSIRVPYESARAMVVQGMPSQSILEYLEKRSRDPMWEGVLWLFIEGDRVAVASNTYRDEDHRELLEILSRNFNVMFIGPTPKGSAPAQKPVTVVPPVQQQVVVERRFDSEPSSIKPSREVLEGVVAKVLRDLGFNVQTNVRLPAKGGEVEVDVWAFKNIGGSQFRVYVSCKNWDRDVNRHVVDQEFGRVLQLDYMPHLRILVVRSLTEPARKAALDDGFMVIELGRKADAENARDIYEAVYRAFDELFTAIAPPRLREIAEKLSRGKGEPGEGLGSSSTRA